MSTLPTCPGCSIIKVDKMGKIRFNKIRFIYKPERTAEELAELRAKSIAALRAKLKQCEESKKRIKREKKFGIWKPPKSPAMSKRIRQRLETAAKAYPQLMYLAAYTTDKTEVTPPEQFNPDPKELYRPGLLYQGEWETETNDPDCYRRHYLFRAEARKWNKDNASQTLCELAKDIIEQITQQYLLQGKLIPDTWIGGKDVEKWLRIVCWSREKRKSEYEKTSDPKTIIIPDVFAESVKAYQHLVEKSLPAKDNQTEGISMEGWAMIIYHEDSSQSLEDIARKIDIDVSELSGFGKLKALIKQNEAAEREARHKRYFPDGDSSIKKSKQKSIQGKDGLCRDPDTNEIDLDA